MKLIAVNGSPRKNWNTAQLLEKVVEGAKSAGMDAKLVHIYDLNFKGCISCFSCKLKGGNGLGMCGFKDGLTPLLEEIRDTDALVLGSPIYFMAETGELRSFMERATFPYISYTDFSKSLFPKPIKTALVYTMNMPEANAGHAGAANNMNCSKFFMEMAFGSCEIHTSYDTVQFSDYQKYDVAMFDGAAKKKRHDEVFPKELEKCFELGKRMAQS